MLKAILQLFYNTRFCYTYPIQSTIITSHLSSINQIIDQYDVEYLGVFGSYARGEEKPGSDLDMVVSFKKSKSLLDMVSLQEKLSEIIGVKVDLITKKSINKYIKPYIIDDLQEIYAKKP